MVQIWGGVTHNIDYAYEELGNAIVLQAVSDLRRAYNGIQYTGKSARQIVSECESYLRSQWCQLMTGDISPEVIIKTVRQQAKYDKWKETTGCKKCDRKECVHKTDSWNKPYLCDGFIPKKKKGKKVMKECEMCGCLLPDDYEDDLCNCCQDDMKEGEE